MDTNPAVLYMPQHNQCNMLENHEHHQHLLCYAPSPAYILLAHVLGAPGRALTAVVRKHQQSINLNLKFSNKF